MKKLLLLLFLLLFPVLSYAQDCTKGQTVTFAQLPVTKVSGTSCTVTDSPNCTAGNIIAAGGGAITCKLAWNGSAWFVGTQAPLVITGGLFATTTVSLTAPTAVGCADATVAVTNAIITMTVHCTPRSNPNGTGGAVTWSGYVSAAGTVDCRACNLTVETTPPAVTYNVEVYN